MWSSELVGIGGLCKPLYWRWDWGWSKMWVKYSVGSGQNDYERSLIVSWLLWQIIKLSEFNTFLKIIKDNFI